MGYFFSPVNLSLSLSFSLSLLSVTPLSVQQVNTQRKAIVQLILEKRELLVGQRVKRDGSVLFSHKISASDTIHTESTVARRPLSLLSFHLPPFLLFLCFSGQDI